MLIGQPSEETIDGAKAMLADHLYERFGRPDMIIGLHDTNTLPAGTGRHHLRCRGGELDLHRRRDPGASAATAPRRSSAAIPITLAAYYITQIQTIVSREEDPQDPTVVTVGDIHGGTKRNIIPDEVKLELTTRSFSGKSRQRVIDGLKQMAAGITAAGESARREGRHRHRARRTSRPRSQYNDPALTTRVRELLVKALGAKRACARPRGHGQRGRRRLRHERGSEAL